MLVTVAEFDVSLMNCDLDNPAMQSAAPNPIVATELHCFQLRERLMHIDDLWPTTQATVKVTRPTV